MLHELGNDSDDQWLPCIQPLPRQALCFVLDLYDFLAHSQQCEVDTIMAPVLWIKKLRAREVKNLFQSHPAGRW